MRFLLIALTLTACSCSADPIMPDAQRQIDAIKADYVAAFFAEEAYEARPICPATVACANPALADRAMRANYNAAALIVTADEERTAVAMAKAKRATKEFLAAVAELR